MSEDIDTSLQLDIEPGVKTPHINGAMIALAREALGMTVGQLALETGASVTSVGNWEAGRKQPSHYLNKLLHALQVTVEFLAMASPAEPRWQPTFRSLTSPEKAKNHAAAYSRLQAEVGVYLDRRVGFRLEEVRPIAPGTRADESARMARDSFGLADGPVPNMVRLAERVALVSFAPAHTVSVDAYSVEIEGRRLITLTTKGDYYRQRWDVAHELGHLFMHGDEPERSSRRLEDEANAFAAEFLLPADSLRDNIPQFVNEWGLSQFGAYKERWGVSIAALVRRSYDLGRMPEATHDHWKVVQDHKGWRRREPGLMERPESTSMIPNLLDTYLTYGVPRAEVIREIGMPEIVFEAIVSRFPVPAAPTIRAVH